MHPRQAVTTLNVPLTFLYSTLKKSQKCLEQQIRIISEGSCDTEDWSNDTENSALPSHE